MARPHILYGLPHSLYTGKARAYLKKQQIDFVERAPSHADFANRIVPVIGRSIIPVLVTPDGAIIQDTVDILDHFEDRGARVTARPPGPRQRVFAHIVELYAVVALTRHAMHYRWSYLAEQRAFLEDAFTVGAAPGTGDRIMARMASYLPALGVTSETIPAIEQSFAELLDTLEAHFTDHPYLLGGQPSIGDYGLLGPLFAHLGRDPVPCGIMKQRSPRVFRWVERMNAPDTDIPEYGAYPAHYLPDDELPATLAPLLAQMGEELFPELADMLAALVDHVARTDPQHGDPVAARPHQRSVAMIETQFRGVSFTGGAQPYALFLWQRVTDAFDALDETAQRSVRAMLDPVGLAPLIDAERPFRVERRDHIEVWNIEE